MEYLIGFESPTGRALVRDDMYLRVLSACCQTVYKSDTREYFVCAHCGNPDTEIKDRWSTEINIEEESGYNARPESWNAWGLGVFGYENFELRFEE